MAAAKLGQLRERDRVKPWLYAIGMAVDPVDPGQPQDPNPGTPSGSLPETGASTTTVAGLALAATTAGAFLCLAAGRRSSRRVA